jgi:diguanylate cyclase (GGDEF)-like protein
LKGRLPFALLGGVLATAAFSRALVRLRDERRELQESADSLQRRNEQVAALTNVFNQIADDMSFEQVVKASLRETGRIMNAEMVSLRRLEGDRLVSLGATLKDGRAIKLASVMKLGVGLTGRAVAEKRVVRIDHDAEELMAPSLPDNGSSQDDTPSPSVQSRGRQQESGIIAPLIVGSRPVGALAVWSTEPSHFTEEDEEVLRLMASQVATALVASSIMEERERQAHLDALTGLPNRLQLAEDLADELSALSGLSRQAVFTMVDIDHFKNFNDEFGHSFGDVILQNIGSVMTNAIRKTDHVYRYGGEEFLIVFMDSSPEEGLRLAERLRQAVQLHLSDLHSVTVSVGLASLPQDGTEARILIERADQALYNAKRAGRNQSAVWSGVPAAKSVA